MQVPTSAPVVRAAKAVLVLTMAFYASLVAFGNITDYGTNFAFVRHVLSMDTIFPDAGIGYRAITSPAWHHAAYVLIIVLETLVAVLAWLGGWRMLSCLGADAVRFNRSKNIAVLALTLGFIVWQVGFMSIGGEWFSMWMSSTWNGIESAFRIFITMLGVLIFVVLRDD